MWNLNVALYAEGTTDHHFLQPVIERTIVQRLRINKQEHVGVSSVEPIFFETTGLAQTERIWRAAKQAMSCDLLIIHCDADAPTMEKALQERYQPGYGLVQQSLEDICKSLIPLVPIRMTEAWILAADYELFKQVLATNVDAHRLGLVSKVKQVEADSDPKRTLKDVVQKARAQFAKRRRDMDFEEIYRAFGLHTSLERLSHVPSYRQFVDDLTTALRSLQVIP